MPTNLSGAIVLGVILAVALVGGVLAFRFKRRGILRKLHERESLDLCDLCQSQFQLVAKDDAEVLIKEIARTLEVPSGLLRAGDRFDIELATPPGFLVDMRMEALTAIYQRRYKQRYGSNPDRFPETVGAYVATLANPANHGTNTLLR